MFWEKILKQNKIIACDKLDFRWPKCLFDQNYDFYEKDSDCVGFCDDVVYVS